MPDSFDSRPSPPRTRARSQRTRGPARSLHAGGPRSEEDHGARTSHGLFCDFLVTFSVTSKPHKTAYLQLRLGGGCMSFSSLIPPKLSLLPWTEDIGASLARPLCPRAGGRARWQEGGGESRAATSGRRPRHLCGRRQGP